MQQAASVAGVSRVLAGDAFANAPMPALCCRSTRSGSRTHRRAMPSRPTSWLCKTRFVVLLIARLSRARPVEQDVLGSLRKAGARACIPHMSSCVRRAARRRACPWPRQATGLLGWRCVPLFGSLSAASCCPSKGQPVGGLSSASRRQWSFVTSARGAPATSAYLAASPARLSILVDT